MLFVKNGFDRDGTTSEQAQSVTFKVLISVLKMTLVNVCISYTV